MENEGDVGIILFVEIGYCVGICGNTLILFGYKIGEYTVFVIGGFIWWAGILRWGPWTVTAPLL